MKNIIILILLISAAFNTTSCTTISYESEADYVACEKGKYRVKSDGDLVCLERRYICRKEQDIVINKDGSYKCEDNIAVGMSYPIGYLLALHWMLGL